jgi:hypothetical protein
VSDASNPVPSGLELSPGQHDAVDNIMVSIRHALRAPGVGRLSGPGGLTGEAIAKRPIGGGPERLTRLGVQRSITGSLPDAFGEGADRLALAGPLGSTVPWKLTHRRAAATSSSGLEAVLSSVRVAGVPLRGKEATIVALHRAGRELPARADHAAGRAMPQHSQSAARVLISAILDASDAEPVADPDILTPSHMLRAHGDSQTRTQMLPQTALPLQARAITEVERAPTPQISAAGIAARVGSLVPCGRVWGVLGAISAAVRD